MQQVNAEQIKPLGNGFTAYLYRRKHGAQYVYWVVLWRGDVRVATTTGLESKAAALAWAYNEAGTAADAKPQGVTRA